MVISMISSLATLTLAFMAFTASAQSIDSPTRNLDLIFFNGYVGSPDGCEADHEIDSIHFQFSMSELINNPAVGCAKNLTGGITSFAMVIIEPSSAEALDGITCYVSPKEDDCAAEVTDPNFILNGSDAKLFSGGDKLVACKDVDASVPISGVSVQCNITT